MEQPTPFTISEKAARQIAALAAKQGKSDHILRITVSGGGCSGFKYEFSFEDAPQNDDILVERDGVKAMTDPISLDFLKGAEIDFVEEMIGSYFAVKNPNAASSCGCGTSFALKT